MADVGLNDMTIDGNPNIDRILQEINGMVGWSRVKQNVQDLVHLCKVNERRKEKDQAQLDVVMNRLFLGNPGTGKTSSAKLYAKLLKELGLLSGGDIVEKTASDLVGSAVGESQNKANDVLEEARGNVLIIDEAHTLNDATGNYGKQVLDTIVEKVSGSADDDIAVLLLGYEEEMLQMLRDCNPGLSRRFPKDQAFYFDDYSDGELLEILLLKAKEKKCKVSVDFAEKAIRILSLQRNAANFGNAGAVETMIKAAFASATKRDAVADVFTLEACDIPDSGTERAAKDKDPLQSLDKLYRTVSTKEIMASDVDAAIAELLASRAGAEPRASEFRSGEDEEMMAPADAFEVAPETKTKQDAKSEDEDDEDEPDEMTDEEFFEKLKALSACPRGFAWNREGDGWRCEGGSHFVTNDELRRGYMTNA